MASQPAAGQKHVRQDSKPNVCHFQPRWATRIFDRNPICLVRQSAKRRKAPNILTPAEIKSLLESLALRERTIVLLAASTGFRQSELFALKWEDIDFAHGTMNVTRSIAYGVVGKYKTEAPQKLVPVHPILAEVLTVWRQTCLYGKPEDWVFGLPPTLRSKATLGPSNIAEARETSHSRSGNHNPFSDHARRRRLRPSECISSTNPLRSVNSCVILGAADERDFAAANLKVPFPARAGKTDPKRKEPAG